MRSSLTSIAVIIARSPGVTAGPHVAINCCNSCWPGVILPSFSISPFFPMGNGVRTYTNSALNARTRSIRVCLDIRGADEFAAVVGAFCWSAVPRATTERITQNRHTTVRGFMEHPGAEKILLDYSSGGEAR